MKTCLHILPALLALILCSCQGNIQPPQQSQMVVEGWIEDGGHPVVILTSTVPVSEESAPIDTLEQYLIRWARVAVSDGEKTVVLSGKYTDDYFPPYIYTTAEMRGESGKTYTLTVDYEGRHATASTTIPCSVALDSIYACKRNGDADTTYSVHAVFRHDAAKQRYFKMFTRRSGQSNQFYSSFIGLHDCTILDNPADILVNSGMSLTNYAKYKSYFLSGEIVSVKLCTLDETSYLFWYDWEESETFASNAFMPATSNIRGNVQGALGYWCGYGQSVKTIQVE